MRALKSFGPPNGGLGKNDHKFSWENWFSWDSWESDFLWAWPIIFMSERGPEIFDVWKGEPKKKNWCFFFCIRPPQQVFVNNPLNWKFNWNWNWLLAYCTVNLRIVQSSPVKSRVHWHMPSLHRPPFWQDGLQTGSVTNSMYTNVKRM